MLALCYSFCKAWLHRSHRHPSGLPPSTTSEPAAKPAFLLRTLVLVPLGLLAAIVLRVVERLFVRLAVVVVVVGCSRDGGRLGRRCGRRRSRTQGCLRNRKVLAQVEVDKVDGEVEERGLLCGGLAKSNWRCGNLLLQPKLLLGLDLGLADALFNPEELACDARFGILLRQRPGEALLGFVLVLRVRRGEGLCDLAEQEGEDREEGECLLRRVERRVRVKVEKREEVEAAGARETSL